MIMEFFTLLLFFILALGFGYSITFFIRWEAKYYEKFFMMIGFGLGVIPVLGIILDHLRIQIYWPIFLVLSLLVPVYSIYRNRSKVAKVFSSLKMKLSIKKSALYFIIVLIMSIVFFGVYHHGAFSYQYLEDDDPWLHARGVKYIKEMRSISFTPQQIEMVGQHYLEPYPPGYDILMGIIHQTNEDVIWTLKFFNVLILSLIGILFYFFVVTFMGSRKKAALSTFFLIVIPCFLSHFIWASNLAVMLFFPALYAVERIDKDWKWMIPAIVVMAGMIMTQMSNPFIFGIILGIYIIVRSVSRRKFLWKVFLVGLIGATIAFSLFWIPTVAKFGLEKTAGANSINIHDISSITTTASGGGLLYSWNDLIIAKKQSKMDNPIGVGIVLFFLLVFSLLVVLLTWVRRPKSIFSPETDWKIISTVLLLISFAGIHGNRLPFPTLMPHRWWAIFAIPVAILCVEGFFTIGKLFESVKVHRFFIYALLLAGILFTSGYPKYVVETSQWPAGSGWTSYEEIQGYFTYVDPLPYNTKVFPLCSRDRKVLALDKLAEPWDVEYYEFKKTAFSASAEEISNWMKSRGYEYITLDGYCMRLHDMNETNAKLNEIGETGFFTYAGGNNGLFMFKLV